MVAELKPTCVVRTLGEVFVWAGSAGQGFPCGSTRHVVRHATYVWHFGEQQRKRGTPGDLLGVCATARDKSRPQVGSTALQAVRRRVSHSQPTSVIQNSNVSVCSEIRSTYCRWSSCTNMAQAASFLSLRSWLYTELGYPDKMERRCCGVVSSRSQSTAVDRRQKITPPIFKAWFTPHRA